MPDPPWLVVHVVGARPNFIKMAPLLAACRAAPSIEPLLVHTGQHYDEAMSGAFFRELDMPPPEIELGVGSGSHAQQTADIMTAFDAALHGLDRRPDAVLVVGDVNSTVACGLVAAKLGIPLVHVEAGLRSRDRSMPEEINRIVTDAIGDLLFCTEQAGVDNLHREGVDPDRVFLVGNLLVDALLRYRPRWAESPILRTQGLAPRRYALLTLHRPANVDDPRMLAGLLDAVERISRDLPVVLPAHPRLRAALWRFGADERVERMRSCGEAGLRMTPPLGYFDFVKLLSEAAVCLTDSGGLQEEATMLGVPCLTLRDNTERPVTVETGVNRIVGRDPDRIVEGWREAASMPRPLSCAPRFWDGRTAERIVRVLEERLAGAGEGDRL